MNTAISLRSAEAIGFQDSDTNVLRSADLKVIIGISRKRAEVAAQMKQAVMNQDMVLLLELASEYFGVDWKGTIQ